MTVGKRALLYLTRKKGRSILLILFIFVMSSFILIGAALLINTNKEIKKIQNRLGNSFTLTEPQLGNYTTHPEYFAPVDEVGIDLKYVGPQVTQDMVDTILGIDGVTAYSAIYYCNFYVDLGLKPGMWMNIEPEEGDPIYSEEALEISTHLTRLVGCADGEYHKYFRIGALEIVDGRNLQNGDYHMAVISDYVAEKNNLSVGDTFDISAYADYPHKGIPLTTCGEPIETKIVGIFHCNFEQEENIITMPEDSYIDNFVFVDMETPKELQEIVNDFADLDYSGDDNIIEHTFFVDNAENIEQIMQEVRDRVDLTTGVTMTRDSSAYEASIRPLKHISLFALILLAAGIIGCAVILFLLLTMWIKSRKHEIGILLSIGISKRKIVAQFLLECIMVSVIGLVITFLLSGVMINGCCKAAEYLTKPAAEEAMYSVSFSLYQEQPIEKISADPVELDYNTSARDVFFVILVICLISSGSVLAASNQVLRMKPRELLQTM